MDNDGKDSLELRSLFQQEVIRQGILFAVTNNLSFSHSDRDIEKTIEVYGNAFEVLKNAIKESSTEKYMLGKPIEPIFKVR